LVRSLAQQHNLVNVVPINKPLEKTRAMQDVAKYVGDVANESDFIVLVVRVDL
jgi:hypothetical protein